MRKFAKTPTYQTIEILGQPAIYTDYRIEHTSVPQGFYLYEIRHSDEDWGVPCQLARNIAVNFYGTIITNTPIQLPPDGLLDFDYAQFYFTDEAFNTLAKFMEAHPAENKDLIEIAAAKESEYALMFSQSEKEDHANGCIGHLRGDFGTDGNEFHTTWWSHQNDVLNTHEFKSDIDRVVNWLREGFAPLKDRTTMRRFCELRGRVLNAEEAILPPCGFSVHTKNYQYMLRCIPRKGDYNFYLYCYDKEAREQERTTPQKNTRPIVKKRTEPER